VQDAAATQVDRPVMEETEVVAESVTNPYLKELSKY